MQHQSKNIKLTVSEEENGTRLDRFLSKHITDQSRSYMQKLTKNGSLTINKNECKIPKTSLHSKDVIVINFPEEASMGLKPEDIPLSVLFEDNDIIVINKPPNMVVHPAAGNWTGTVVNALLGRDKDFAKESLVEDDDPMRPGIVHRLDKDTSGCLVIAKNPSTKFKMSALFAERKVSKTYAAITYGQPKNNSEKIITLIGRHRVNRKKMAVVHRRGKEAITIYKTIKKGRMDQAMVTHLEVKILTGRTHQIRVHLAHKNIPILGDVTYGGKQPVTVSRQMLHAWKLSFPHPQTGEEMCFEAPFPADFKAILDNME
jgi:23S rRNA pseudouridine1911/1915/1917 synthase